MRNKSKRNIGKQIPKIMSKGITISVPDEIPPHPTAELLLKILLSDLGQKVPKHDIISERLLLRTQLVLVKNEIGHIIFQRADLFDNETHRCLVEIAQLLDGYLRYKRYGSCFKEYLDIYMLFGRNLEPPFNMLLR